MNFEKKCKEALQSTIEEAKKFDWSDPQKYALWSAQTFYYVHHSTRLLALSASRCPLDKTNFHNKFVSHITEERGHENLSKKDLLAMRQRVESFEELPETQAMYQSQYYWIEHVSPYALFGYILALEGLSVYIGGDVYKKIVNVHGEQAAKFLKVHAEEDISHLAEVYKWIDKLPEADQLIVNDNLKLSAKLYKSMLIAISQKCEKVGLQHVA